MTILKCVRCGAEQNLKLNLSEEEKAKNALVFSDTSLCNHCDNSFYSWRCEQVYLNSKAVLWGDELKSAVATWVTMVGVPVKAEAATNKDNGLVTPSTHGGRAITPDQMNHSEADVGP